MPSKFTLKEIKKAVLRFPKFASRHFFLSLAVSVLLALVLGGIFFWKYCCKEEKLFLPPSILKINRPLLEEISLKLDQKEQFFKQAELKVYPDPFRGWEEQ